MSADMTALTNCLADMKRFTWTTLLHLFADQTLSFRYTVTAYPSLEEL